MSQNDIIYHPAGTSETSRTLWSDDGLESKKEKPTKCLTWIVTLLAALVVATNGAWAWAYHQSQQSEVTRLAERPSFGGNIQPSSSYLPTRIVMQPIYQDTEFNEDGDKKERADNLWKGLFPDGNGVLSLNISEARKHSLHDTAKDPLIPENGLYIVAGFHTMHCLTVLRSSLWHYKNQEEQTVPWGHIGHCLDMVRQTLMCNLDTTLMWLRDEDTFADGQLHVCKDFWGLHQWIGEHAG